LEASKYSLERDLWFQIETVPKVRDRGEESQRRVRGGSEERRVRGEVKGSKEDEPHSEAMGRNLR
jgi:hypothetical protein